MVRTSMQLRISHVHASQYRYQVIYIGITCNQAAHLISR